MINVIYERDTGRIVAATSSNQDYKIYFEEWGQDFIDSLASLTIDKVPNRIADYYVKNGELVKYSEQEIEEKRQYGRILTDEERQLNKLKPSYEEVKKAENTIEILTLLQEVM